MSAYMILIASLIGGASRPVVVTVAGEIMRQASSVSCDVAH